jgi:hypothetical protein
MITYTGRNGTDLLLAADAKEMEEDFGGDSIILTLRNNQTLTLNRGDSLVCRRDGVSVVGPDSREVVR